MYLKNLDNRISLRISDRLLDKLGFTAKKLNISVSDLIRSILDSFVNNSGVLQDYEYNKTIQHDKL